MKPYRKGFRSERELLRVLSSRGYSCVRSASSGNFLTPVDIVALKAGRTLAFEIKSWSRMPRLDRKSARRLSDWAAGAGAHGFLAWYNKNEWRFLPLRDALAGNYSEENWIPLENFLRVFP